MTDNELIAEFMGFKFAFERGHRIYYVPSGEDLKYKAFKLSHVKFIYDTSWDWLMPVVEKIDGLDEEYTTRFGYSVMANLGMRSKYVYCSIENWKGDEIAGTSGGAKTLIEAVYKTVLGFVKWYNENKKP